MITKYKLCILILFLSVYSTIGMAQTSPQPNYTLLDNESGTEKAYIARDSVTLKPGFQYAATTGNTFSAKIDAGLLFPSTDKTYADANGNITSDPTQGGVVGSIPGQFGVSSSGGASYTVPIECPPGINGMQPNVSLAYNSQGVNGIAGWGWNISGISMISRVPKNYYYDGEKSGIIWDNTSPLALDGQRLIEMQRWNTDSVEYDTEAKSGNRIVGCNIKSWGPEYFKIYTKSGQVIQYGNSSNAASYFALNGDPTTTSFINLSWAIASVKDNNGNSMDYTYKNETIHILNLIFYRNTVLDKITYGGNLIAGTTANQTIQFVYKTRNDITDGYIDGKENYNNLILDVIKVISNGTELKTYATTYDFSDNKSHLTNVALSNDKSEHLNPLNFQWSTNNYQYTYQGNVTFDFSLSPSIMYYKKQGWDNQFFYLGKVWGDIDGDGDQDILVKCKLEKRYFANSWDQFWGIASFDYIYIWVLYRNDNGLYRYVQDGNFDISLSPHFSFVHDDTDGKDDLLIGYSTQIADPIDGRYHGYSYKYDNGVLTSRFYDPIAFGFIDYNKYKSSLTVLPADFLGKGIPQNMLLYTENNITSPFQFSENFCIVDKTVETYERSDIYISDFNGNGKSEFVYVHDDIKFYEFIKNNSTGRNTLTLIYTYPGINHFDNIYPGDFNGDGNTDFLIHDYPSNEWKFLMSTGKTLVEMYMNNTLTTSSNVKIMDVNHDGKSDILFYDDTSNGRYFKLLVSNGTDFEEKFSQLYTGTTYGGFEMDGRINGDKYDDVALAFQNSSDLIGISNNVQFNKISSFQDSYKNNTSVNYDVFNSNAVKVFKNGIDGDSNDNSNRNVSATNYGSWDVVNTVVTSAADNSMTNITGYIFNSAIIHKQGKGILGYLSTTVQDLTNSIEKINTNQLNSAYYILYPYSEITRLIGETTNISENTIDYYPFQVVGKSFNHYLKTQNSNNILGDLSSKVEYLAYDSYGNPKSIKTTKGDIIETKTINYVRRGAWCDNKVNDATSVKTCNNDTYTRTSNYEYDGKGNLTKETVDPNDKNEVITEYKDFDDFGHAQKVEFTANSKKRTSSVTFKPSGRFIASKTNVLNEKTRFDWDEIHGLLNYEQDDRDNKTMYKYDNWGQTTEIQYPTGIRKAQVIQWASSGSPTGAKYNIYRQISGSAPITTWYDVLGRELVTETYGLKNKKISVFTEYYSDGRKKSVSEPTFNSAAETWAAKYYYIDPYKRLTSVVTPLGTSSTSYSGRTTTITTPEGTQETTMNNSGLTYTSKINDKTVTYTYYPSGLPKTSTPQDGQSLTMYYNLQGNRIKLEDPDAGTVETTYNGFGELTEEKQIVHAKNQQIKTTNNYYDTGLLNNIVRENINTDNNSVLHTETTSYIYDTEPKHTNRVKTISINEGNKQTFGYDLWDRVISVDETVGTKVFNQKTEYDFFGRIKKNIYPTGYYTTNTYDNYSNLMEVNDSKRSIWKAIDVNAKGQLLQTSKGGKITTYDFYENGLPKEIKADSVMDMFYVFDEFHNLYSREDKRNPHNLQKEVFGYDALNRLTNWTVTRNGIETPYSMTYDDLTKKLGNIVTKSGIATNSDSLLTMSYGGNRPAPDGSAIGPHALATIGGVPATPFPSTDLNVTYTDFKKIETLSEGAGIAKKDYYLTYGVDDQRRMSVYKEGGVTKLTRYYLGNYEEEVGENGKVRKIHYLSGAILIQEDDQPDKFYYSYSDYQGSLLALTDADGALVPNGLFAYDPWGVRRNPDNWNEKDSRTTWIVNRGYTGHEHLDAFGIINMNGRVYDPYTAMFFSPDPYVQAPDNWLNYNRYGYCYGNPFKFSDPTGLLTWYDVIAGVSFLAGVVIDFIPGMLWLGTPLVIAGFSHFALTIDQVQNSNGRTSWDQASNNAGINFSGSTGINNQTQKEKKYAKVNNDNTSYINNIKAPGDSRFFQGTDYDAAMFSYFLQNNDGLEHPYMSTDKGYYFEPTQGYIFQRVNPVGENEFSFKKNHVDNTGSYASFYTEESEGGKYIYPYSSMNASFVYYASHPHPYSNKISGPDLNFSDHHPYYNFYAFKPGMTINYAYKGMNYSTGKTYWDLYWGRLNFRTFDKRFDSLGR